MKNNQELRPTTPSAFLRAFLRAVLRACPRPITALLITTILGHVAFESPAMAATRPLRFVYLQGFVSCSKIFHAPIEQFFEAAKTHPDAKLYYGCFDGGFTEHIGDYRERFFLYTLTASDQWSSSEEMDPQSAPLAISLKIRREMQLLRALNPDAPSDLPLMDVMVAGHSHGGWMAMRAAYQFTLVPQLKLQELLTIDPVSYVECPSEWFPWHVLSNLFHWAGDHDACHRAPMDLVGLEPSIAEAIDYNWTNVYEITMPYLSSGPIGGATRNFEYTAPPTTSWLGAHRAVLLDPSTWSRFSRRVLAIVQNPEN
jgi:hypothetical protein